MQEEKEGRGGTSWAASRLGVGRGWASLAVGPERENEVSF